MAQSIITAPDGSKFKVTHPDDASDSDVLAYAQKTFKTATAPNVPNVLGAEQEAVGKVVKGMGPVSRFAAGMGAGVTDLAQGISQTFGGASQKDVRAKQSIDQPLTDTTSGKVGRFAGQALALAPTAMIPGANTAVGASLIGAGIGGAAPIAEGDVAKGKILNAEVGALLGVGGNQLGNYIGNKIGGRIASNASKASQQSVKTDTIKAAREVGYVLPPTQANPTLTNKVVEGLSGKAATAQKAAQANEQVTDNLARKALGMAPEDALTPEALQNVREQAGAVYKQIADMPIQIKTDAKYTADLNNVLAPSRRIAQSFPKLVKQDLQDSVDAVTGSDFHPAAVVEVIKRFRDDATSLFKASDPGSIASAKAYRGIADAMEGLLDRNLKAANQPELYGNYVAARQLIAKAHTVEGALNKGTGHVVAAKLAAQLTRGKPLSMELLIAARTAKAFPKALQEVSSSMPGISPLDAYASAGTAILAGNPAPLAIPAGRVAARSALLSEPFQNRMLIREPSRALPALKNAASRSGWIAPLIYNDQQ